MEQIKTYNIRVVQMQYKPYVFSMLQNIFQYKITYMFTKYRIPSGKKLGGLSLKYSSTPSQTPPFQVKQ